MKFILGKKLNMTQIWKNDEVIAVTRVQTGICTITQVKSKDKDGYEAVQVGFGEKKEKNIKKPQKGHLKGMGNFRYLREFRVEAGELKKGQTIDINTFEPKDAVAVTAISKGKGFQGVVKRHGFKGTKATHGNKDQLRMPGSIGATGPAHVFKGTKMGGRMGGGQITVVNLEIVEKDIEKNILLIKGGVPGARNGLVLIKGEGELKLKVESVPELGTKNNESKKEEESEVKKDNKKIEAKKIEKEKEGKKKDEDIEKVVEEADEKKRNKKETKTK
ncbi:50S ribosomal protein L3 [bacterium]|nr:50S ribosomal protein L3 [bacterium]